jgi:hypothetical protein
MLSEGCNARLLRRQGIAPLRPLHGRERQCFIAHRVEHVDKWHLRRSINQNCNQNPNILSVSAPYNRTCITHAACRSGRAVATAPTSIPPALAPCVMVVHLLPMPRECSSSTHAMKSEKVFFFANRRPLWNQLRPLSAPPLTHAVAAMKLRDVLQYVTAGVALSA